MKATLSLTHRCNLTCEYCYSGRSLRQDMSLETARQVVEHILTIAPENEPLDFNFFGGEPLIRFELLKEIVTYIQERSSQPVRFNLTTNGTLLTEEMLDYFQTENINLCFSLDGPKWLHDRYRTYADGRGSYDDVQRNLQMALEVLNDVQVNAVYNPDHLDAIPETLSSLVGLGVSAIHLNPNIYAKWTAAIYPKLREVFKELAELYCNYYEDAKEIALNIIDSKLILFVKGGYSVSDLCSMAHSQWAFAPSGNVYPCERFIGEDQDQTMCLGNIHQGILQHRCQSIREKVGNRNKDCIDCRLKSYCMNWCGCTNYFMTGHLDATGPGLCAIEKASIQAAEYVFVKLVQDDNDLFQQHLMTYVARDAHIYN